MHCIKIYTDQNTQTYVEIPLYYEFYFYYYMPYVLLEHLKDINPTAEGLFLLNKQGIRSAHLRRGERIYLTQYDDIPIEDGHYILNCLSDSNHIKYRIELFYNARYIIGVHSGALSNMNFAQSNITIIELMPYKSSTSSLRMTCSMFNSDDLKACAVIYYILNFNYLIKLIGFYLFLLMIKEI
ncbi:unnamed protein product [Rotaria sp. Silwood2]|nr:unnamed protein product [Rotaria sp. Silwood2]CAF4264808.1 unnamed protein product [Rotaria sp. Silwood2]CAF4427734.1 unnamed protein product [Rotaria sp. Silwood2]